MSKASLAIRIVGVVLGITVLGGGVALATAGNPKPEVNPTVSRSADTDEPAKQDEPEAVCPTPVGVEDNDGRAGEAEDCETHRGDHETDGHETDGHDTDGHETDGHKTDGREANSR